MKKIFCILSAFTFLLAMVLVSACGNNGRQNNEEEKYDVIIKVKNSLGDEWIFDLDTEKLTCELEYTGQEIDFYVDSYNMPNHPQYSENWLSLHGGHGGINNEFDIQSYYYDIEGTLVYAKTTSICSVKERGTCIFYFQVDTYGEAVMQLKYRSVILNVVVE